MDIQQQGLVRSLDVNELHQPFLYIIAGMLLSILVIVSLKSCVSEHLLTALSNLTSWYSGGRGGNFTTPCCSANIYFKNSSMPFFFIMYHVDWTIKNSGVSLFYPINH